MDSDVRAFLKGAAWVVVVIFVLWLVIFGIASFTARYTPQAGEIGVVREGASGLWVGAWFNGHNIKKVVPPGSGNTGIGLGAEVHSYPADSQQRYYTITSDKQRGDRPGVDVVNVPTSDGVNVGIEATIYFNSAFNGSPTGTGIVKAFDNRFGVRTFPVVGTSDELHAWEGSKGWEAFLDGIIRPIIDNDLRQQIATVSCAQLQASCALVYNQNATIGTGNGQQANGRITAIQNSINASLQQDIRSTLGEDYFSQVQFRLSRVTLPERVQTEIGNAQAAFAAVGTAAAKVKQEYQNYLANVEREKGYRACPACAEAAVLAAIPANVTTFAPGAGFAITK